MENKDLKYKITSFTFVIFLVGMAIAFVVLPKQDISKSERRKLSDKPILSMNAIMDERFMEDLEEYLLDHFPFRESFRKLKAYFAYDVLKQKENNGIYVARGHAAKLEYPLNEINVERFADKVISLQKQYFPNGRVFYSIVPDKNYFLAEEEGYPVLDYHKMSEILNSKLSNITYIDIYDTLTIDDYYFTDTHWKQESLLDTLKLISLNLGIYEKLDFCVQNYEIKELEDFYGVYYGQSALALPADKIKYLTNSIIENAKVWNLETNKINPVYELNKINSSESVDMYDIFLGGAAALQVIENANAADEKNLIIFRDSYTSSLAPLLIPAYSKIVLIDLRYMSSSLLDNYVDFYNADILFMYSTSVINNSSMLK